MTYPTRPSDPLTYRYPRTLRELENRFPCNAEEAQAIHGPYKGEWDPDTVVLGTAVVILVALVAMAIVGWI